MLRLRRPFWRQLRGPMGGGERAVWGPGPRLGAGFPAWSLSRLGLGHGSCRDSRAGGVSVPELCIEEEQQERMCPWGCKGGRDAGALSPDGSRAATGDEADSPPIRISASTAWPIELLHSRRTSLISAASKFGNIAFSVSSALPSSPMAPSLCEIKAGRPFPLCGISLLVFFFVAAPAQFPASRPGSSSSGWQQTPRLIRRV